MGTPVEVVGPAGERGTVDAADVAKMAPGWRPAGAEELAAESQQESFGGLAGQAASAAVGLGRSASFSGTDMLFAEAANIARGPQARRDVLKALNLAREVNPGATTAGEFGGLLVGGGGIVSAGEHAGAAVASRVGEGLLGKVAEFGARGAVEGAGIGAQQAISEDVLGDHELNGQAIFAHAAKDALIGGAGGAVLGVPAHYLGRLLRAPSGRLSDATLDEVAGVEGAGRAVQAHARSQEAVIDELRRRGSTAEQAAQIAEDATTIGRAKAEAGPFSGLLDSAGEAYANKAGGADPLKREAIAKAYEEGHKLVAHHNEVLDLGAQRMSKTGTEAVRKVWDEINEAHFTERPEAIAKMVDPALYADAREAALRMGQVVREAHDELGATAMKGGGELGFGRIGKELKDFTAKMSRLPLNDEAGPLAARDAFMAAYKLMQAVGKLSKFGSEGFQKTEAQNLWTSTYETLRRGLEDEAVWGPAGAMTRDLNEAFTTALPRYDDFMGRFAANIDRGEAGVIKPNLDLDKIKNGLLSQLRGNAIDTDVEAVKSTQGFIDGMRNRLNVLERTSELTPARAKTLAEGKATLANFEKTFLDVRKQAAVVARVKRQQEEEIGKGVGGLLGIVSDAFTRPATTAQRLAHVRETVSHVEQGVKKGLRAFFGRSGGEVLERVAPRAKADSVAEMTKIRELAQNPPALEAQLSELVGDLGKVAPMTAEEVKSAGRRAIHYLAQEMPPSGVRLGLLGTYNSKPRFSDQQVSEWESKRRGALGAVGGGDAPRAIVADMKQGRLNRDAIKAMELVSPKLFARTQELAREQLFAMEQRGELDKMPYQQKAAIAALLKIPADGTFMPDFIEMIQAAKVMPAPATSPQAAAGGQRARKTTHPTASLFATESQRIEGKAS